MIIKKSKVIIILIILGILLYNLILNDTIIPGVNSYSPRRVSKQGQEIAYSEQKYQSEAVATLYLQAFLNQFAKKASDPLNQYMAQDMITEEVFLKDLTDNLTIQDTDNTYFVEYNTSVKQAEFTIHSFTVYVVDRELGYPKGYNMLAEIQNIDASKSLAIQVLEYAPYDFKVRYIKDSDGGFDFVEDIE